MTSAKIKMEKFDGVVDYNMRRERLLANLDLLGLTDALQSQEEELRRAESKLRDPSVKGGDSDSESPKKTDPLIAEKQWKVRSTIIMNVTDTILRKILKEKTAAGMLKVLYAQYMSLSLPNRMYLKQRLYGFRMNESISIESNIDEFLRIITDLGNVMVEVSDEDQAILLLMSLQKQFDQLRDTLRYGKETVTMDEVMNSIHSKQLEFSVNGKGNKNQGEVLYSSSSSRGRSREEYQACSRSEQVQRKVQIKVKRKGKSSNVLGVW